MCWPHQAAHGTFRGRRATTCHADSHRPKLPSSKSIAMGFCPSNKMSLERSARRPSVLNSVVNIRLQQQIDRGCRRNPHQDATGAAEGSPARIKAFGGTISGQVGCIPTGGGNGSFFARDIHPCPHEASRRVVRWPDTVRRRLSRMTRSFSTHRSELHCPDSAGTGVFKAATIQYIHRQDTDSDTR